jgi:diketogulonate reductase-like aldo/keto reductase
MALDPIVTLADGRRMPALGLGVWQIKDGRAVEDAVRWALEAGIRHIDTAMIYRNERGVGAAIRSSGIPREDLWITTKLFPAEALWVDRACHASLRRLGLDYVDLYLVHFPPPGVLHRTWRQMESLARRGLARSIGVSNYGVGSLVETIERAEVAPVVNQIQLSPFHHPTDLVQWCQGLDVTVEAYSPLARGKRLDDAVVTTIATAHARTTAQVLIRWSLQHGFVVIPKSEQRERIEGNAKVFDFELSDEEMRQLDALG